MDSHRMKSFKTIAQKLLVLARGQCLICMTSVDLSGDLTWPDLDLKNLTGGVEDTREKLLKIW